MEYLRETCVVCQSRGIVDKYLIQGFHILECQHCSLMFVGEKLSREELKAYYEKEASMAEAMDDYIYSDPRNVENLRFSYTTLSELIRKRVPVGKVLDVGCSAGDFLDCMKDWECHGIELVSVYAARARAKFGDKIHVGTLEDYEGVEGSFDAITLQNVFDHMLDPLEALRKCHRLLKPGGVIAIKVHDVSCLFAKLTGSKFYAFNPPQHLLYFNKKSLRQALELCGFKVEEYRHLVELLFLKTVPYRLSRQKQGTFFYRVFQWLDRRSLGHIKIRKNLHDIITVFARKTED